MTRPRRVSVRAARRGGAVSARRAIELAAVAAALALWPASPAAAHPLGNFTVNTYSGLQLVPGEARVEYVVDMAEIPAFQEMTSIDRDRDGEASPQELSSWAQARAPALVSGVELEVDGAPVPLEVRSATARLRPGQGGLSTLRFEGVFAGAIAGDRGSFTYADTNFADRVGWHEITAVGENGFTLTGSSVPTQSVSDALLAYPQDLLTSPLHVTSAKAGFEPGVSAGAGGAGVSSSGSTGDDARPGVESGPFVDLIANRGIGLVALAVFLAVAFGAWHALLPGHGKTLMAAYMVGSGAKVRQAVAVGSAVAIMHTASVLALGLLVLTLEQTFRPEALYPWLGLASGLVALALGAGLLITRVGAWMEARRDLDGDDRRASSHDPAHDHAHVDAHDHAHGDAADHGHGHGHPHLNAKDGLSRKGLVALALAGGILPAPSALIVMLAAINAHRVVFGLSLVLAFSAGLAAALIVVGLGALKAREAMARRMSTVWGRLVPVLSASAIVAAGAFLSLRGLAQI